ncbi:hypothetical protein BSPCLSOX_1120, partial [uncultured Gammaproteobacteria bacterium]
TELVSSVMVELGYTQAVDIKLVADSQDNRKGHYGEDNNIYLNDTNLNNTKDLATTLGHETSHAIDNQDPSIDTNPQNNTSKADNEIYAQNYGDDFSDYVEFASENYGDGNLADTNNNNLGNTPAERQRNQKLINNNNQDYAGIDKSKGEDATAFSDVHDNQVRETEIIDFAILAQELEAQGKLEDAQETREEVERLKEQVAEFKEAYGQDFDEQIKNLAVEYEQIADGNTEAYFTLLTLAEGTVLLNGVKALVAKVGGAEALKIIAKETAMSIKDAGAFVNDLVRGRGFGNVRSPITNLNSKKTKVAKNIDKKKSIAPSKRNSDTIVLGKTKNPNYADVAKENNYRNFEIPKKVWNSKEMTKLKKWEANKKFLDRAIAKNNKIKLSHNPKNPNINTGYFKKEIDYLKSKGFKLSVDGKSMIPPSK